MALPNGTSGYQVGAGNVGEPIMFAQGAPTALTAGATATPAQLAGGLFTFNGTAGNLVLPTVALWEAAYPSTAKVDAAFDFFVVGSEVEAHGVSSRGSPDPRRFNQISSNGFSCRISMPPSFTSSSDEAKLEAKTVARIPGSTRYSIRKESSRVQSCALPMKRSSTSRASFNDQTTRCFTV